METRISVIVPVYNVEKYLERCVKSLTDQTLREIQIILVDDGSLDGSGELCRQFAKKDSRIQVISKKNEGQGLARNSGLSCVSGKYVTFVDSDDYIDTDTFEVLWNTMESSRADLCCYSYVKHDTEGKIVYKAKVDERLYENNAVYTSFLLHYFGDDPLLDDLRGVSACMSMFRTEIINHNKIRFLSERKVFSEDTLFCLDYCKYIKKVVTLSHPFYHYCLKADSFTKGYQEKRLELTIDFCNTLSRYACDYKVEELVSERINMVLWITLMDCVKQEILRSRETGVRKTYQMIREICNHSYVKEVIRNMNTDGFHMKQKLFWFAIRRRLIPMVMILGILRVKQGI